MYIQELARVFSLRPEQQLFPLPSFFLLPLLHLTFLPLLLLTHHPTSPSPLSSSPSSYAADKTPRPAAGGWAAQGTAMEMFCLLSNKHRNVNAGPEQPSSRNTRDLRARLLSVLPPSFSSSSILCCGLPRLNEPNTLSPSGASAACFLAPQKLPSHDQWEWRGRRGIVTKQSQSRKMPI